VLAGCARPPPRGGWPVESATASVVGAGGPHAPEGSGPARSAFGPEQVSHAGLRAQAPAQCTQGSKGRCGAASVGKRLRACGPALPLTRTLA
jgi:hypothetical protein